MTQLTELDTLLIESAANHPDYGSVEDALYDSTSRVTLAITNEYEWCREHDMLVIAGKYGIYEKAEGLVVRHDAPSRTVTYDDLLDPDTRIGVSLFGPTFRTLVRGFNFFYGSMGLTPELEAQ